MNRERRQAKPWLHGGLAVIVALVVCSACALAGGVAFGLDTNDNTDGADSTGPPTPTLTEDQAREAKRIAFEDERVRLFLHDSPYDVHEVAPWVSNDGTVIGAVVQLTLSPGSEKSITNTTWPAMSYDRSEKYPQLYSSRDFLVTASEIAGLWITVAYRESSVVAIAPSSATNLTVKPVSPIQPTDPWFVYPEED